MSYPKFVVVGHPNKGKSSLVATLTLNDTIAISDTPGTTKKAREFYFKVDGKVFYELIDTPGFQRARRVLEFLTSHEVKASQRPKLLKEFVKKHCDDKKFVDECELLKPIVDGAGIIYVVDASKPYSDEYEVEMEILRYAGAASIAILNYIGDEDFTSEWDEVLGQYFRLVKKFDPLHSGKEEHLDLIDALSHLNPEWSDDFKEIKRYLNRFYDERKERVSGIITTSIKEALSLKISKNSTFVRDQNELKKEFRKRLQNIEKKMQKRIYKELNFKKLELELIENELKYDLLSQESREIFGLKRDKLLLISTLSGAGVGGMVDLLAGGHSFFLGSIIGGVVGFASASYGYDEISKIKFIGSSKIEIGPIKDPNFGFIFLSRALEYSKKLLQTTHANKNRVEVDFNFDDMKITILKNLAKYHEKFRDEKATSSDIKSYEKIVLELLDD